MAAMGQKRVEMKTDRVETGWFYAAPAVLNSLTWTNLTGRFLDLNRAFQYPKR
jgi:hypothetical protein